MSNGVSFTAWYSLSRGEGHGGQRVGRADIQNVQDHLDPSRRRAVSVPRPNRCAPQARRSRGVWNAPWASPCLRCSASIGAAGGDREGIDLNSNGVNNDIDTEAFDYDGLNSDGTVKLKDRGACTTINCGRGASQSTYQPARVEERHLSRHDVDRGVRRGVQPVQREEPQFSVGVASSPGYLGMWPAHGESGLPASDGATPATARTRSSASARSGSASCSKEAWGFGLGAWGRQPPGLRPALSPT